MLCTAASEGVTALAATRAVLHIFSGTAVLFRPRQSGGKLEAALGGWVDALIQASRNGSGRYRREAR
jgi:hypothetical protein